MEMLRQAKLAEDPSKEKVCVVPKDFYPNSFADDVGSNNSGFYELKVKIKFRYILI